MKQALVLLIGFLANLVKCSDEFLSKDEVIALTRDHLGRSKPDELLNGFIPVWAFVIFIISATFLVIGIVSGVCYLAGCRNPHDNKGNFKAVYHNDN